MVVWIMKAHIQILFQQGTKRWRRNSCIRGRGRPRKLTPRECARLQGFPNKFKLNLVSDVQFYKQFGNSVPVNVVTAVLDSMIKFMKI